MPRVLTLAADHTLRIKPIKEIEMLRLNPRVHRDLSLADGSDVVLKDIAGDCMEIDLKIDPGSASQVGLRVRRAPKGREETIIAYEPAPGKLILDVTRSSLDRDVRYGTHRPHTAEGGDDVCVQRAPFQVSPSDTFMLRIFLDRSIIEVYCDDRQCVTQRIYPSRRDALGVSLFCRGGSAKVISLNAWDMAVTNP
jgi:sucrose-6-phosphate hydrolase SacC (GH32 family)